MNDRLVNPITVPATILRAASEQDSGGVDVVAMADLNSPTIDCTFHDSYCLEKFHTDYRSCLIACEPPLAFINYKRKGVCV